MLTAICTLPLAASAATTTVESANFNDNTHTGYFCNGAASSLGTTVRPTLNNDSALTAVAGTSGRGWIRYFPAQNLNVGDSITLSFKLSLDGTFGTSIFTTGANTNSGSFRFGLFNSNGGALATADSWSATNMDSYRGYLATATMNGRDAAGAPNGSAGSGAFTLRSRSITGTATLVSSLSPFTTVGAATNLNQSFEVNKAYAVTVTITRGAGSNTFSTTISGGQFVTPFTYSQADAASPVSTFDNIAMHILSNVADSFSVDDVLVTVTSTGVTTPVITWAAPAAINYGTAISSTQLNATASAGGTSVPGTFVYSPAAGSLLGIGAGQSLNVTFTPTDAVHYSNCIGSTPIDVNAPAGGTSLVAQNFNDGTRTNVWGGSSASNIAVSNHALTEVTSVNGRGWVRNFTAQSLTNVGDSITWTFRFTMDGAAFLTDQATLAAGTAQIKFGLFNSNGGPIVAADSWAAATDFSLYRGYSVTPSLIGKDAGGTGEIAVRSRTNAVPATTLISSNGPFETLAGSTQVLNQSFATNTLYLVTITAAKVATGTSITTTIAGGAFGSGFAFTKADAVSPVSVFDTITVHSNSGISDTFTVDDLSVVYSPASSIPAGYLSNLSVRAAMAAGQTLIVGFVVDGGAKPMLVRAAGPALNAFGLTGVVDPSLALFSDSTNVGSNSDWNSSLASTFATLGAFPFANGSKDAALQQTINGPHTAQATATGAGSILVEAYDAGPNDGRKLTNLSARFQVGTGDNILIAGFVVAGSGTRQVLIRAVGPTLIGFGVTGALADPQFSVFDGSTTLASDNDWSSSLSSTFATLGAFALDAGSKDAATIVTLQAGKSYTVQVSGVGNTTGEALVEIYLIP